MISVPPQLLKSSEQNFLAITGLLFWASVEHRSQCRPYVLHTATNSDGEQPEEVWQLVIYHTFLHIEQLVRVPPAFTLMEFSSKNCSSAVGSNTDSGLSLRRFAISMNPMRKRVCRDHRSRHEKFLSGEGCPDWGWASFKGM